MADIKISHALVLPDINFLAWYEAVEPYTQAFKRVAVVRSPAGNDLNRFYNVTAVEAPGVWFNNNALTHIRRSYPNVVRVDLIRASTPQALAAILDERIRKKDRYGETMSSSNIDDRFILQWPSDARPVKVIHPFDDEVGGVKNEGMDVFAPENSVIRAGAAGQVVTVVRQPTAIGYGQYVQTATQLNGVNYLVIYAHLKDIKVNMNDTVEAGDELGKAGGVDSIKIVVQRPGDGLKGYPLPDVIDPTLVLYWPELKLRPTVNGLRIRERPGTDFDVVAKINIIDEIETLEPHGRTFQKLGVEPQWLKVRTSMGTEGYTAAWFLTVSEPFSVDANFLGMNLDARHGGGNPEPAKLQGAQWVRFGYDVSMESGSTDINRAFNVFKPAIERHAAAGKKVMLVFTHETFGEGQGFVWPEMTHDKWIDLTNRFSDFCRTIAAQYANQGLVHCYQIWNEQDTPPAVARAAVPVPPAEYGNMLTKTMQAIRSVDSSVKIITGGHASGPGTGVPYARQTLAAMPSGLRPDGIAFHPYGRGAVSGAKYSHFGAIGDSVRLWSEVMPDKPVWITEWGILDQQNDPGQASDASKYAKDFITVLATQYPGKIAAAIWYAYADGMDNGYGIVLQNGQPKQPLHDTYLKALGG